MFFYALRLSAEHQLGVEMQKIKYDKKNTIKYEN